MPDSTRSAVPHSQIAVRSQPVAAASQSARSCRSSSPGELRMEVRVGVHTCEVERRGDDVAGIGVHIAARVQGCAQPGQVWVSRTVTDLVAGSGIVFAVRGDHELKGVADPWRLFTVEV